MEMIKCPICNKDISPNAVSCPNCGEPIKLNTETVFEHEPKKNSNDKKNNKKKKIPAPVIGIFLILVIVISACTFYSARYARMMLKYAAAPEEYTFNRILEMARNEKQSNFIAAPHYEAIIDGDVNPYADMERIFGVRLMEDSKRGYFCCIRTARNKHSIYVIYAL